MHMLRGNALVVWTAITVLIFAQVGHSQITRTLISAANDGPTVKTTLEGLGPGDIVEFGAGTFRGACGVTITAADVTILGAGKSQTIFNCSHQDRHFHLVGQNAAFSNLHITGGRSTCVPSNTTECGDCQCGQPTPVGGYGGCVLVSISATFTNVKISECTTSWHGGGVAAAPGSRLHLQEVEVAECQADQHGGGVFLDASASVVIMGSLSALESNSAQKGGAVYGATNANISINGQVVVADNVGGQEGGALYISGGRIDIANGAVLRGNTAINYGGAVSARDQATVIIMDDVTVVENSVRYYGGAFSLIDAGLQVSNTVSIHANSAGVIEAYEGKGGGIFANPGTVLIHGQVNITANWATASGGALHGGSASTAEVDGNVRISDNYVDSAYQWWAFGGGFSGEYGTTLTFRNGVLLEGNWGMQGGAIYATWDCEVLLENGVTARNNEVSHRGGVISTFAYVTVTIRNGVELDNNICMVPTWSCRGGTIYVSYSDNTRSRGLNIHDDVMVSGGNGRYGGCVYGRWSHGHIANNVTFTNGYAYTQGGAIYWFEFSTLIVEGVSGPVRITDTYGYLGGAILLMQYAQATFRGDVLFEGNTAGNG
eukprot:3816220-Rhodomonas_salina.2